MYTKHNSCTEPIFSCFHSQTCSCLHRLGFIIDFLSRATLVGFMAGSAIIVSLQQFKGVLGIQHFTPKMDVVYVLHLVLERRDEVVI